jgi:putative mycofactocin binding protein MftB
MTAAPLARTPFNLDVPWALAPQVSIRPEAFGALAYHFGTRRLSFLKTPVLRDLVQSLAEHPSGRDACSAIGIAGEELGQYARSLGVLARTGLIGRRSDACASPWRGGA